MDELMAVCRELDSYAGAAADESVWQGVGMFSLPIEMLVALRRILRKLSDYNEAGVYQCIVCRDEPVPHPGMTCGRCQRMRSPKPDGVAPWEVVA